MNGRFQSPAMQLRTAQIIAHEIVRTAATHFAWDNNGTICKFQEVIPVHIHSYILQNCQGPCVKRAYGYARPRYSADGACCRIASWMEYSLPRQAVTKPSYRLTITH
eukprot:5227677-Pleurochrysis_carterae.AAC.1